MFKNIDEKIKVLAIVSTIIGCLTSVVAAIIYWCDKRVLIGFAILVGGCLASWLGSFVLYGIGELLTQTTNIAKGIQNIQVLSAYQNSESTGNITKEMIEEIQAEVANDYETQKQESIDEDDYEEQKAYYVNEEDISTPNSGECPSCFSKISAEDAECPNCGYKLK